MKVFTSHYFSDYYKNWIYLGTAGGRDYYLQYLPTKEKPYPSYSIVYGFEPNEYISTTLSVADMLDNKILASRIPFYAEYKSSSYMLHLIAFIREYSLNNEDN